MALATVLLFLLAFHLALGRPTHPILQLSSKVNRMVCPDGENECPSDNTCCKMLSGYYGCCPQENAVCCSDGKHCCPNSFSCDVSGSCSKQASVRVVVKNVVCPDGGECPDSNTCCPLSSGGYGCCPQENAECCSDGEHCCPSGYTCDVADGTCTRQASVMLMLKQMASKKVTNLKNVICPDGSECPDSNTCCPSSSGGYGCCPQENAECCSDGEHCCPSGYTCNVADGTCSLQGSTITMLKSMASKKVSILKNVICPDNSQCPDSNTCCPSSSGGYGCCPQENAVCCSDGEHCCPSGYTCNVAEGTCERQASVIPMLKKMASKKVTNLKNVICPDNSQCPDSNTCCPSSSGGYGCCPQENAVCCSDGEHCCPSGYTCNVAEGTCERQGSVIPMLKKMASKKVTNLKNVICPDGQSECPDSNTCCKLSSGQWGCCPEENAVCCSDGKHCCPSGYTCDLTNGKCTLQGSTIPMLKSMASKKVSILKNVICPDNSQCPDSNTCCPSSSGGYGCCPQENAVCCSDGKHCCPSGYTCDVADGTCTRQASVIPMLKKMASKKVTNLKNVICPDGQSECPDSNTCCKLSSGQWGCCPEENAVCCSDGKHCCPSGYTCDLTNGKCTLQGSTIPMLKSMASKKVSILKNVICPDNSQCPDSNTCCPSSSGGYGCCPQVDAVCCNDGEHCCPSGYTCDVSDGTCTRQASVIPMLKKTASKKVTNLKNIICPDGQSECHDGNTCCQMSSGQWACCPLPDAVCCGDGQHCCPAGYSCDTGSGTCVQRSTAIPMFKKRPSWIGSRTNDRRL